MIDWTKNFGNDFSNDVKKYIEFELNKKNINLKNKFAICYDTKNNEIIINKNASVVTSISCKLFISLDPDFIENDNEKYLYKFGYEVIEQSLEKIEQLQNYITTIKNESKNKFERETK